MEKLPAKYLKKENKPKYRNESGENSEIVDKKGKSREQDQIYDEKISAIVKILDEKSISQLIVHGGSRKEIETETKEKKETWSLTPDLDAESATILFNFFNKKPLGDIYEEKGSRSSIVPKGGNAKDLEEGLGKVNIFIDNGNRSIGIKKPNEEITKIYLDHHGKGRGKNTSATQIVYDILKKQNPKIDEEHPWLSNYVKNVTNLDNLNYINREYFDKNHFKEVWPYTLNHLAPQMKAMDLLNLFNAGVLDDFSKSIKNILDKEVELKKDKNDREVHLEKIKIRDIILKNGKTINQQIEIETSKDKKINNVTKTIEGIEKADKFSTDLLNFVVYNNNKKIKNKNGNGSHINIIPNHLSFIGTKALGYNTYASWNQKEGKFFINSKERGLAKIIEKLNQIDPGCATDVRGVMVFGEIKNLTEEKFKEILDLNENTKIQETSNEEVIAKKDQVGKIEEFEEEPDPEIIELQNRIAEELKTIADLEKQKEELGKILGIFSDSKEDTGKENAQENELNFNDAQRIIDDTNAQLENLEKETEPINIPKGKLEVSFYNKNKETEYAVIRANDSEDFSPLIEKLGIEDGTTKVEGDNKTYIINKRGEMCFVVGLPNIKPENITEEDFKKLGETMWQAVLDIEDKESETKITKEEFEKISNELENEINEKIRVKKSTEQINSEVVKTEPEAITSTENKEGQLVK